MSSIPARTATARRATSESSVEVSVDLDGSGAGSVSTGVRFYDHMLLSLAKHSLIDLTVKADGAVDVAALTGVPVVAVHVDEPEAADDVRAVLAAADEENDAERSGDVGATSESALDDALQRVTDRDLLWYDPTEIPQIPRP